jgi:uncharacterized protein (DUF58 family)
MRIKLWLPLLILITVVGAIFHSTLWLTVSAMLLVIMGVTYWWREHALDHITYRRKWVYRRSFPGERSPLTIEVENRKLLPVSWLQTSDQWPRAVSPEDSSVLAPSYMPNYNNLTHLFSLRWYERTLRSYTLLFRERGIYPVGPVRLTSGDLFGLYEKSREEESSDYLVVFPDILPLTALKLDAEDPFGDRRSRFRIFEDPNRPMGIREYHPEDGFRRVHWPATARTGSLQVKVYQPVSSQVMVVCLNVATLPYFWEGILPALLEQLVKVAATLVYQGVESGYSVGLISNGHLAHSDHPFRIMPGRSRQQLGRLLETLAAVTPFTNTVFEQFLIKAMPDVPFGATLVIVTAIFTPELAETLVRLRRYRKHMTVISLALEAPVDIPGIRMIHLPFAG